MRRRYVFPGGSAAGGVGVVLAVASLLTLAGQAHAQDGEQAVISFVCAVDRGRAVPGALSRRQFACG